MLYGFFSQLDITSLSVASDHQEIVASVNYILFSLLVLALVMARA